MQIVLSGDERAELVRRAGLPGRWRADRARIILACAEGMSNAGAAQALGVAVKSVSKWRRQFAAERLAGLEDAAPVGRRKAELIVTEAERAQLIRWARRAKTAQYLALRAKIVLRCAEGGTNKEAAADLGVDESTVERWRARFIARRLDGLQNSVSSVTRRMVTLESNLAHGTEAIAAELAGLQARVDQLASALETSVNCLILLVERIAQP